MATFSTNQFRNVYVVNDVKSSIQESDAGATIAVGSGLEELFFTYKGAGGITRTDVINKSKINYALSKDAADLRRGLQKREIVLDPTINGGNPIPGQIYILGITIRDYGTLSPEDTYYKNVAVQVTTGMTATQFYQALADQLTLSWSRESIKMFTFTPSATSLVLEEVQQPWELGLIESRPLNFDIKTEYIIDADNFEVPWGVVTTLAPTSFVGNGQTMADLEYFALGERGDVYRNVGFPYVIPHTYFVDPTKEYHTIELDFFYSGEVEDVQKSKKHLTLIGSDKALMNTLITNINTAMGSTLIEPIA